MTTDKLKAPVPDRLRERANALDRDDPLGQARDEFIDADEVIAYFDGNSLGRPLRVTGEQVGEFVQEVWGKRLIRAWDEGWMDAPTELGDAIGRVTLGAAPGQTVVGDSTTVLLYKLARAAVDLRSGRDTIVLDTENFPTDRFVAEGIAAERGLSVRWVRPDPIAGLTPQAIEATVDERTALVLLSHVSYRSGQMAQMRAITEIAHSVGALILWDLCHSVGVVELSLDEAGVDLAVGCTYKYLNGGPGAPAFAYVARALQGDLRQPIQGWMGAADPFAMGERYEPAAGVRRLVSGTPPILAMLPMRDMLSLVERAGMAAIRAKSVALTEFAIEIVDACLAPLGAELASPRASGQRGGHVTVAHPSFSSLTPKLWVGGVIPDFRPPQFLRIGLSPLSTSFAEVATGLTQVADLLGSA